MFLIIFFREDLALLIIYAMKYTQKYIALYSLLLVEVNS